MFIRISRGIWALGQTVKLGVAVRGRSTQVVCTNLPRAGGSHILGPLSSPYRSQVATESPAQRIPAPELLVSGLVLTTSATGGRPMPVATVDTRSPAVLRDRERRDEPVPVSPVDRFDELDDLAFLRMRDALEAKRRRVQGDAEGSRLVLVRDRRLDRLLAADDDDPVAVPQQLVEGPLLEVACREPGHMRGADVHRLDRHALAIREPEAFGDEHGLRGRDVEKPT